MSDTLGSEAILGEATTQEADAVQSLDRALRAEAKNTNDLARWHLARWIIWLYCGVVAGTAVYEAAWSFVANQPAFPSLLDLIKVAVIPVIAFVLGYYYGAAAKA